MTRPGARRPAVALAALLSVALLGTAGCTATTDGHPAGPTAGSGSASGSKRSGDPTAAAFTDPGTAAKIRASAARDVEVLNSYDYRSLPAFLAKGTAVTTGAARTEFTKAVSGVITPNAPKVKASQTATVNDVGLGAVSADGSTASALVFLQVSVTNTSVKAKVSLMTASAQLTKIDGKWLLSQLATAPTAPIGRPPGTPGLTAAATGAETAVRLLTTYRRATFAADFAAALAATAGQLHTDTEAQKSTVLQTLTNGKFDLTGTIRTSGVERAVGKRAVVLVVLDGFRSGSATPSRQNLIVTVTLREGKWLATDVTAAVAK